MFLATILSGAPLRRRLSTMATAAALGVATFATLPTAAGAATITYDVMATKFTRLSPLSSISGSFSIDYVDGVNRLSSTLGPTATLGAVDLTIGGTHFDTTNTALRFRGSDQRMTLGGTAGGSLSVLDTDATDFILSFALGRTIDARTAGKSFVYSQGDGESYAAGTLFANIAPPVNARAMQFRVSLLASPSVVTPIPAPALLFVSALGLVALLRRRQGARPSVERRLG